jgi:hypothetical protein
VLFGLTCAFAATGWAALTRRFSRYPFYLYGLQFHSSNECNAQLAGGCIDEIRDGVSDPFELIH